MPDIRLICHRLAAVCFALSVVCAAAAQAQPRRSSPRNVIFILSDDHRAVAC